MSKRVIRYFQSPAFTAAEWSSRNPYLNSGEIGYLLEGGVVTQAKVGPGLWNDLEFVAVDRYNSADTVTNPIGAVTSVPTGQKLEDIIHDMLSPYLPPSVYTLVNNAGGTFNNVNTREVGESFAGPIDITFGVNQPGNLSGATPINVNGGGYLTTGSFAFTLPIPLSVLTPPLNPIVQTTIVIGVTLTHINGTTSVVTTLINFFPRVMWTSSPLSTISDGTIFNGRPFTITNDFKKDYNFSGGGYSWLAIPSMLAPSGLVFTDVTDPNAPAGYSMESMGTLVAVNNGVGTYNYETYRSTYDLISSTILRVR